LAIINEVYSILDEYETEGCDLYNYNVVLAIGHFFRTKHPEVMWVCDVSEWPNEEGAVYAFAWVENNKPNLVMFDVKYSRGV
jgi:hypothetical protein